MLLATPSGDHDDGLLWSPVAGKPLLAWALAALRAAPEIGPIALVAPASRLDDATRLIAAEGFAHTHVRAMPPGAGAPLAAMLDLVDLTLVPQRTRHVAPSHRQGQMKAEIRAVVLHDAARPFISAGHIVALVTAAVNAGLAVSTEPVKETIKRVAGGQVVETLPRDELAQLIPPLAVRADLLPRLHGAPDRPSFARIMDYVAAALAAGLTVRTVPLAGPSLAVTSPGDLLVAEALLQPASG